MTTIQELLITAADYLSAFGTGSVREDAELILASVTETSRTHLISYPEQQLTPTEELFAWRWIGKRAQHYPIQYMRGVQEFYGHEFLVSPAVLVPRPETELLVDVSRELLEGNQAGKILDIGTGTGCIAITLLLEMPALSAVATDLMESALVIARANALRNACYHRLRLIRCDTAQALLVGQERFELVVSNPPYIARSEKAALAPSVARYEPSTAVFAGDSGLEVMEKIFNQAADLLIQRGHLVLELGYSQGAAVLELGRTKGWVPVDLRKDLAGIDRCAVFRRC